MGGKPWAALILQRADVTTATLGGPEPHCQEAKYLLLLWDNSNAGLFIFSCAETGNLQQAEALEPRQSRGHLNSTVGAGKKM